MKPVSIVIVTRNGLEYTKRCLQTLRSHTAHSDFDVVVADSASSDGTLEYLRSLRWVALVENGAGLGFAKGANRALRLLPRDRDIVLLGNCTEVNQPRWLELLQDAAYTRPEIGLVGCRLRSEDGVLQHAGEHISPKSCVRQQIGRGERDVNQFSANLVVDSVAFACVYIKREVLEKVGLLSETLCGHFEDADLCFRARQSGYSIVCCGQVTLINHEHASAVTNSTLGDGDFLASQTAFRNNWQGNLPSSRYTRQLGWHSLFEFPSGYAISSRKIAHALDRKGVELSYRYIYGSGTCFPVEEPETSGDETIQEIRERILAEDHVMVQILDFVKSHRIYSKTILENCVRGFIEYVKQKQGS